MIPRAHITAWRTAAPWPTNEQVEQVHNLIASIAGESDHFRRGQLVDDEMLPLIAKFREGTRASLIDLLVSELQVAELRRPMVLLTFGPVQSLDKNVQFLPMRLERRVRGGHFTNRPLEESPEERRALGLRLVREIPYGWYEERIWQHPRSHVLQAK